LSIFCNFPLLAILKVALTPVHAMPDNFTCEEESNWHSDGLKIKFYIDNIEKKQSMNYASLVGRIDFPISRIDLSPFE
jgi:hypothetical protein